MKHKSKSGVAMIVLAACGESGINSTFTTGSRVTPAWMTVGLYPIEQGRLVD